MLAVVALSYEEEAEITQEVRTIFLYAVASFSHFDNEQKEKKKKEREREKRRKQDRNDKFYAFGLIFKLPK